MTAVQRLRFRFHLSDGRTEANTWSLADMELVTIQRARDIYGITSNDEKRFMKEFSIRMIEFESWLETIGI
jgi:hypothetical protein